MNISIQKVDALIIGGGIGGLSTAHDLLQRNFQGSILILERNDVVGGQARSGYLSSGSKLPTEMSWRIYANGYKTIKRMMQQIPYPSSGKTVLENLVDINNIVIPQTEESYFEMKASALSVLTKYLPVAFKEGGGKQVINRLTKALTSSKMRLENQFEYTTWKEYFDPLPLKTQQYIINFLCPILGIDIYQGSFLSVLSLTGNSLSSSSGKIGNNNDNETIRVLGNKLQSINQFFQPNSKSVCVMNGPTNERFFNPWVQHLQNQNVEIRTNTSVIAIYLNPKNPKQIIYVDCITSDYNNNNNISNTFSFRVSAQHYVLAIPIEILASLFRDAYQRISTSMPTEIQSWGNLATQSKEYVIGMQYYFTVEFKYHKKESSAFYLPESAWQIIIEPAGLWRNESGSGPFNWTERDPLIKDYWSIGLCDRKTPGILITKSWLDCSQEEIFTEVWAQITASKGFMKFIPQLQYVKPYRSNLWYSYQPIWSFSSGGTNGHYLDTWEPKFSPNAGTWHLRPEIQVQDINNAYIATAYTKGSRMMILMDAAAEAGARVAEKIVGNHKEQPFYMPPLPFEKRLGGFLLSPLLKVDEHRFKKGQTHLAEAWFGNSTILMLIVYMITIIIIIVVLILALRKLAHKYKSRKPKYVE